MTFPLLHIVCMCVCMYAFTYIRMYVCTHIFSSIVGVLLMSFPLPTSYMCMYVCTYACMYAHIFFDCWSSPDDIPTPAHRMYVRTYVCVSVRPPSRTLDSLMRRLQHLLSLVARACCGKIHPGNPTHATRKNTGTHPPQSK
jgi:hypothetical protein